MDPTTTREPFPDDISYLQMEVARITSRCKRIDCESRLRDAEADAVPHARTVGTRETPLAKELHRRLPALKEAEVGLRRDIDSRLAINRTGGPALALDRMADEYRLDGFERTVLLMACMPCLGHDVAAAFNGLSEFGYAGGTLTPEMVWALLGLDTRERIVARLALLPTAPLLKHNLVKMVHYGSDAGPANIPGAAIEITGEAFARLVGVPELHPQQSMGRDVGEA